MGKIVVSTFLRALLPRLRSVAPANEGFNPPLVNVLIKLVKSLELVAGVIDDAEKKVTVTSVKEWLQGLGDLLFEVSDLIDEVQSEVQPPARVEEGVGRVAVSAFRQLGRRILPCQLPGQSSFSFSAFNRISKEYKLAKAFKQIFPKLDLVVGRIPTLGFLTYSNPTNVSRANTSIPYACFRQEILGREDEKKNIKDAISKHAVSTADSVLVVGIVGIAGIGKTSLAHLIYDDPDQSIRSLFEIKLWVNDGEKSDSIFHAVHQMSMQAMEGNHLNPGDDFKSLEQMVMELHLLLRKNRFLLVVDGTRTTSFFDQFLREAVYMGSKGSVVIVTTRSLYVANGFRAFPVHHLGDLSEGVSAQLFTKYAFASNGLQMQPEFDAFAKRIVKLCRGHPMALKTVATYLYNKNNLQQWTEVLKILEGQDANSIFQVLKYIGDNLPSHLKLPFCTLQLQKVSSVEELICLWMALGFLHSDDSNQQPEDIGRMYLKELAESPLHPDVEYAPGGVVREIKIHDLVNDLAINIAHEQWFWNLRPHESPCYNLVKYLILEADRVSLPDKPQEVNKIQLIMLHPGVQASAKLVMDMLSSFRSLRALGLGGYDIEPLPDSIGQLKHLRYLDAASNELLTTLPDSICNLWHLQTLLLHGCHKLKKLPAGIGRLKCLRYLTLTTSQERLQEEIGQLTSLRTLGFSSCQQLVSLPGSLKNLKKLQRLGIVDCPKVNLMEDTSVEALNGMDVLDTLLLSGLSEFEHLPNDLRNPNVVVMKHLSIQSSIKLTRTAWISQFPHLHSLTIEDCSQLSTLMEDNNPPFDNMAELIIKKCPRLGDTKWVRQFPSLQSLIIEGCPNLVALDPGFNELKKLERLEIRRCPVLIRKIQIVGGEASSYIFHVRVVELDGVSFNQSSLSRRSCRLAGLVNQWRRIYGKYKMSNRLSLSRRTFRLAGLFNLRFRSPLVCFLIIVFFSTLLLFFLLRT